MRIESHNLWGGKSQQTLPAFGVRPRAKQRDEFISSGLVNSKPGRDKPVEEMKATIGGPPGHSEADKSGG